MQKKLTPLMNLMFKQEDTKAIKERAKELFNQHTYYRGSKAYGDTMKARFVDYLTHEEAHVGTSLGERTFLIPDGQNVYSVRCFELALRTAREENKVKQNQE